MATVVAQATMSLDGFIAYPDDSVGPLFDWYGNGDTEVFGNDPDRPFRVSAASAEHLRATWPHIEAEVIGRRLFDLTDGWGGVPAVSKRVVVVTHSMPVEWQERHPDAPFTFVTEGVERAVAIATEQAGDGITSITAGDVLGQALRLGLVDELRVDLAPVVLGKGRRFFGDFADATVLLDDPEIVQGDRVTHLTYRVRRS